MIARVDLLIDAQHPALFIDEHTYPFGISCRCILTCAIRQSHNSASVAQKWEIQAELACECSTFLEAIKTHTDKLDVALLEIWALLLEALCFGRAAGRGGFWEEPDQHLAST